VCNNWLTYTNGIAVISSTHVSIYSNDVFSSQNHAVSLEYSQNASVYTNTLHDNPGSGIFVGIGTGGTEVFSNAVRSNSRGIEINNTDNVTVTGNIVQKSTGEGIAVNGATGVALSGNTISRNNVGLFFDEKGGQSTATNNEVCYNTAWDIFNGGKGNTGSNNTCAKSWAWQDAGATSGCSLKCIGWYQYNYGYQFQNSSKYPLSFGASGAGVRAITWIRSGKTRSTCRCPSALVSHCVFHGSAVNAWGGRRRCPPASPIRTPRSITRRPTTTAANRASAPV